LRTGPYLDTDSGFKLTPFMIKGVSEGSVKPEDRTFNKVVNGLRKAVECLWGGPFTPLFSASVLMGPADIINRFPILAVRLQWFSKDFEEYKRRVANLITGTLILQNVCLEHNDVWQYEREYYKSLAPIDNDVPVDDVDGKDLQAALYRYINARVTIDVATGVLLPKPNAPPPAR
jgi:hypothetical protein